MIFEIRGSVFDFSRPSAVNWRCFLLNLKRENQGAGLWKKFSQIWEVWKIKAEQLGVKKVRAAG